MDAASFRIAFMKQAGVANASIGPAGGAVKNLLALLSIGMLSRCLVSLSLCFLRVRLLAFYH